MEVVKSPLEKSPRIILDKKPDYNWLHAALLSYDPGGIRNRRAVNNLTATLLDSYRARYGDLDGIPYLPNAEPLELEGRDSSLAIDAAKRYKEWLLGSASTAQANIVIDLVAFEEQIEQAEAAAAEPMLVYLD